MQEGKKEGKRKSNPELRSHQYPPARSYHSWNPNPTGRFECFSGGGVLIYEGRNERKAWRGGKGRVEPRAAFLDSWGRNNQPSLSRDDQITLNYTEIDVYREDEDGSCKHFRISPTQLTFRILLGLASERSTYPGNHRLIKCPDLCFDLSLSSLSLFNWPDHMSQTRASAKKKRKRIRRLPAWALVLEYPITRSALEQRRIPLTTPLRTRRASTERSLNPFHHSPPLGSPRGSTR